MRFLIAVLAAATSLVFVTSDAAAAADVRITALDCGSHPRRIRIENMGDATQDLSGWQLQSDAAESGPFDLSEVVSLDAAKKFFVFQGHLSPPTTPASGYYRWGSDEIFNLRANDSSDYVRLVDPQGNTIDQRNCEGLPPGATPAPPSEFDPPPLSTPVVTPVPATPAPAATAAPAPTSRAAPAQVNPVATASASAGGIGGGSDLPPAGGPPLAAQSMPATLPFAVGALAMAVGTVLVTLGFKRRQPGQ